MIARWKQRWKQERKQNDDMCSRCAVSTFPIKEQRRCGSNKMSTSIDIDELTCSLCYNFTSSSMNAVLRHIGAVHAHLPGFRVVCGINGCPRTYTNYYSYRKHIRRKHSDFGGDLDVPSNLDEFSQDAVTMSDTETGREMLPFDSDSLKRSAVLFTLKSKEVRNISQLAINDLIEDVSMIVQQTVDTVAFKVSG